MSSLPIILSRAWVPFVTAAPVWNYWWLLLLPLVAGVAVVYKTTKVNRADRLLPEAAQLWLYIIIAMVLGAIALAALVWLVLG